MGMPAETRMGRMTQDEIQAAIDAGKLVIIPTGATEAHGPHMPTDTDSHQAEHMAALLAARIDAVVAPALPYAVSKTFEHFPGTISLSIPVYQEVLYEVCAALVKQDFRQLLILNGNRPNGTSNDAVARRLVDDLDADHEFKVTAVSYWEPGSEAIHALRTSPVGGMGHAGEYETSFQLAVRPELVKMDRLDGVETQLVGWDLAAPMVPVRTYARRPRPQRGHPAIFGAPQFASAEAGATFIDVTLDALVEMMLNLQGSYEARK